MHTKPLLKEFLLKISRIINVVSAGVRWFLRMCLLGFRPMLGPDARCYFSPPCTEFACLQLEQKPLVPALWAITKRLLCCNPVYFWVLRLKASFIKYRR